MAAPPQHLSRCPQWLISKKRLLLRKREQCEAMNRKTKMRQKMMIQDMLRVSSKQKIPPLENRRLFLPWQSDYSLLKTEEAVSANELTRLEDRIA